MIFASVLIYLDLCSFVVWDVGAFWLAFWEHSCSGLGVSSLPLDSDTRVRFPSVARGIAAPWPLVTAWEFRLLVSTLG